MTHQIASEEIVRLTVELSPSGMIMTDADGKIVLVNAEVERLFGADLVAIGRYIKADNPRRAETFVAELESRCHQLGAMPKAFTLVPRHERSGVRRRPYGDYLIFYRIVADTIEVLCTYSMARKTMRRSFFPMTDPKAHGCTPIRPAH